MKSEPDVYSIDHLHKDKTTWWEGVRNYQARNFMTQNMQVGDQVLFYHSNATPPGLAGIAEISKSAEPDKLHFDSKSEYYDPKATKQKPNWFCVQIKYVSKFKSYITLDHLKNDPQCKDMLVIKKGQRLSIQPLTEKEFKHLCKIGMK